MIDGVWRARHYHMQTAMVIENERWIGLTSDEVQALILVFRRGAHVGHPTLFSCRVMAARVVSAGSPAEAGPSGVLLEFTRSPRHVTPDTGDHTGKCPYIGHLTFPRRSVNAPVCSRGHRREPERFDRRAAKG